MIQEGQQQKIQQYYVLQHNGKIKLTELRKHIQYPNDSYRMCTTSKPCATNIYKIPVCRFEHYERAPKPMRFYISPEIINSGDDLNNLRIIQHLPSSKVQQRGGKLTTSSLPEYILVNLPNEKDREETFTLNAEVIKEEKQQKQTRPKTQTIREEPTIRLIETLFESLSNDTTKRRVLRKLTQSSPPRGLLSFFT